MTTERSDDSVESGPSPAVDVAECITSSGETIEEVVDGLCDIADSDPELVDGAVNDLAKIAADGPTGATVDDRVAAVSSIADFATRRPEYASEAVAALGPVIDDPAVETTAIRALATVTAERPATVDPVLGAVARRLIGEPIPTRESAVRVIEARADADPAAVTRFAPELVEATAATMGLDLDSPGLPDHERSRLSGQVIAEQRLRQRTTAILEAVAAVEPVAVGDVLDRLVTVLDPANDRNVHLKDRIVDVVRVCAETAPEDVLAAVEPLVAVVESETVPATLRANAAGTLATLADAQLEATTEHARAAVFQLGDLLEHEEPAVRANAGTLLSYVAQRYPGEVAPLTDTLVDRLDDEQVPTRAVVVWTLGYVDNDAARAGLRKTAATDPDPDIRALAVERLPSESGE